MDVQHLIDQYLAQHPEWAQYYEWVRYIPQGEPLPETTTAWLALHVLVGREYHTLRVAARGEGVVATWGLGAIVAGLSPQPD